MKTVCRLLAMAVGAMFLFPAGAQAFNLYTAPSAGHTWMYCSLVNVSKQPLVVTITIRDYDGNALNTPTPQTLNPGVYASKQYSGLSATYCKFNVKAKRRGVTSRKRMVRAMAKYHDGLNVEFVVPAQ